MAEAVVAGRHRPQACCQDAEKTTAAARGCRGQVGPPSEAAVRGGQRLLPGTPEAPAEAAGKGRGCAEEQAEEDRGRGCSGATRPTGVRTPGTRVGAVTAVAGLLRARRTGPVLRGSCRVCGRQIGGRAASTLSSGATVELRCRGYHASASSGLRRRARSRLGPYQGCRTVRGEVTAGVRARCCRSDNPAGGMVSGRAACFTEGPRALGRICRSVDAFDLWRG